jgi:hypothetical protein
VRARGSAWVALGLLAIAWGAQWTLGLGTRRRASAFSEGSVFNESPDGLSLALRYLRARPARARARSVGVLSRRVTADALPANAVVFRMRPRRLPFGRPPELVRTAARPLLTRAEEGWLRGGGRLVLGLDGDYGPVSFSQGGGAQPIRKVFPAWPGVRLLGSQSPVGLLSGPAVDEGQVLFVSGATPALVRLALGRGELLLLAAPAVLENGRLRRGDHLRLLEALAGERPVLFDEWVHGYGEDPGFFALLLGWGFGPSFAAGALAFTLLVWRGRTRLGVAEAAAPERRSEAVDLVDSLAQLYDRALSRRDALALHVDGLRTAIALRSGSRGDKLERRLRELLDGAPPDLAGSGEPTPAQFLRTLQTVNEGYRRLQEHGDTRHRP